MSIITALINVQDTTGLLKFATNLIELGVKIYAYDATNEYAPDWATKGAYSTASYLKKHKIPFSQIDYDFTGWSITESNVFDEHLIGRRTTYNVDLFVVNLPDVETIINKVGQTQIEVLNQINTSDINYIRLVAKHYDRILPIITPVDYDQLIDQIKSGKLNDISIRTRYAQKVFGYTSKYDSIVSQYLYLSSF